MKPYWTAQGWNFARILADKMQGRSDHDHPEMWPGYNDACREREKIRPHIEHGYYPERLFKERAPNQTDAEAGYMRANYRQVTLAHYDDYQNSILRALHENNWSITYGKGEENEEEVTNDFKEYVTKGLNEFGSYLNYVRYIVPKVKTLDAMGLMVVLPKTIAVIIDTDGNQTIDPEGEIDPVPQYIPVNDVWGFDYDRWYLWLTNEKSWVNRGQEKVKDGLVLMMVDDQNVYKITQVGEKFKFIFQIDIWWAHELGYAPAIHLRGNPKQKEGMMVWQSPYLTPSEPLDQVLLDYSYLGASKAKCVFPHPVMIGDDCEFVDNSTGAKCYAGDLSWTDTTSDPPLERHRQCPSCKGSGMKSRMGPLGTLLVRPPNRLDERGESPTLANALSFVGPDVATLDFLQTQVEANTQAARTMLHLSTEQPIVGGEQKTATQSGIDNKGHYAFIKPISDQVFDIYEFLLVTTGEMRYGPKFTGVSLTRPDSFDVRTEADMAIEIADGRKNSDLPPAMMDVLVWSYAKARNQNDPGAMQVLETIAAADYLFTTETADIQYQLSQGVVEKWQVVLHFQAQSIYDELARTSKLVSTEDHMADVQANAQALIEAAKARTPKTESPAAQKLAMQLVK